MKWIDFFMWSILLYIFYYAVNIFMDTSKGKRPVADTGAENVLHFTEHEASSDATLIAQRDKPIEQPAQQSPAPVVPAAAVNEAPVIKPEPPIAPAAATNQPKAQNPIEGQGVTIQDFFALAQIDAVDFINAASFT